MDISISTMGTVWMTLLLLLFCAILQVGDTKSQNKGPRRATVDKGSSESRQDEAISHLYSLAHRLRHHTHNRRRAMLLSEVELNQKYQPWSAWTSCSRTCTQKRYRDCKKGTQCRQRRVRQERTCLRPMDKCGTVKHDAATGKSGVLKRLEDIVSELLYHDWTEWSVCTRSCKKRRYRTCALKRWCKDTVLMEEAPCYYPGTKCEKIVSEQEKGSSSEKHDEDVEETDKIPATDWIDTPTSEDKDTSEESPFEWDPNGCGMRNVTRTFRIVGGSWSRKGAWPWQVAILTRWKEQYCGGTLISPYHVLTAAHCIRRNGRKRKVLLRAGEFDLSEKDTAEIDLKIDNDVVHDDFDIETIDSDIAIIKLKHPVPQGKYTNYACVPDEDDILPPKTLCYAVGWGKMKNTHLFGEDVLREAKVPLVKESDCQDAFEFEITPNQMCAGFKRGGVDTCAGDSGGPLMCRISKFGATRWYVYGVTSFGEGCGDRGKYGIYTIVPNFAKWIRRHAPIIR